MRMFAHVRAETRVPLRSDRLSEAFVGQSERSSTHQRHLPGHPSLPRLSPASAHFTLTNAQEQAAPAETVGGGDEEV